jgi:transcriptional regulator with XRE-family HTH domain
MSDMDTFGPRLRAERERRGISLDTIASVTKVGAELWDGLERNDFSRWPSGIFARAFVRDYARAVGLDADDVVNEFCRLFPIGDRRASRLIKAQAELIGHQLTYAEAGALPPDGDRRTVVPVADDQPVGRPRFGPRSLAATIDTLATVGMAGGLAMIPRTEFWPWMGVIALVYYGIVPVVLGATPGRCLVDAIRHRVPALFAMQDRRRAHA